MFSRLHKRVRETIKKYRMLDPGERILAAVSGGADSVCLTLILLELGYELAVVHVNHGLRGQASDEDESFSGALAAQLGLRFFSTKVTLGPGNIEAAGRDARRAFFNQVAEQQSFSKIAVAHTRSDRVETFLFNLLRGAGSAGLASMPPVSGRIIRPLLEARREDIESFLRERGQQWRSDASNFSLEFTRNHLRHVVIPRLASEFNPNLVETLSRTVEILDGEDAWMRALTDEWLRRHGTKTDNQFVIEVEPLGCAPLGLVRRVLRGALVKVGSELQDVTFDQLESIRILLQKGKSGKRVEIPGGFEVAREFDHLAFRRKLTVDPAYEYELSIPGSVLVQEARLLFKAELVESEALNAPSGRVFVDADSIGPCVRIRNWKPGDYYKPIGLPGGKVKKLFQRARIPRSHRTSWPVVVADSSIIWVASFPVSREFAPRGRSQKVVAIEAFTDLPGTIPVMPTSKVVEP